MKPIFIYLAVLVLLVTALSCRKDGHERERQQIQTPQNVTATIRAGQTYVLSLGAVGTATISKQASHHEVSEIVTAPDGNNSYRYLAAKGYTGADEVTLQQTIKTASSDSGCYGQQTGFTTTLKTTVVKLNIAN